MNEDELVLIKQLAGMEDLEVGFGNVSQVREGENVTITRINAYTIPFDNSRSIGDVLAEILAKLG